MNNAAFGKTMENVRKHRDTKLVTTDKRRNKLASEPNYNTTNFFSKKLLVTEVKKIKVKMNKPVYLGLSILNISKTLMYEFGMIILNQSIITMQNQTTSIQTTLLFILKVKIFRNTLQMMLKKDSIHQIMNSTDHCLQKRIKRL